MVHFPRIKAKENSLGSVKEFGAQCIILGVDKAWCLSKHGGIVQHRVSSEILEGPCDFRSILRH